MAVLLTVLMSKNLAAFIKGFNPIPLALSKGGVFEL
jgi:hypothetical protein